ncbi:hypothetical protein HPP92_002252 [Vanilla planifolia]|uniref:NAC domain-containing protein n=1 Tax=Vanilla planifolia TaxID=51239 RepID=A0A835VIC0_VANPL|nr:hypothetical protein HPP92_002252 [Vanilla planifolia]
MSILSMVEAGMPPGFRFHPRDEELVCDYLQKRVFGGGRHGCSMMVDVDLNKCEPWELPAMACVGGKQWYFFSLRDRKYATGQRTNRATRSGYWKATGKDRPVTRRRSLVGMRKTLVFYQGRAPRGKKTDWVMHEFRLERNERTKDPIQDNWVLCRVFFKTRGLSPNPPPAATGTASFDPLHNHDGGSVSLPPPTDTLLCYDHSHGGPHHRNQSPVMILQGYDEQVPCFSNLPLAASPNRPTPPPQSSRPPIGWPAAGIRGILGEH